MTQAVVLGISVVALIVNARTTWQIRQMKRRGEM